jgi:Ca2+-binding EF-hand superfamily protein
MAMIFSPNGEPLNGGPLGRPTCRDAMSHWFDRVDANHDGVISREEFMADAQTQFQRMDIDKNGYLLAEEVGRFRLPYEQQSDAGASAQGDQGSGSQQAGRRQDRRGGSHGGKSGNSPSEANPADQPDPVMSAGTGGDFKVTPDEFLTQARNIFAEIDADHHGVLSRDDVLKTCEPKKK